MFENVKLETIKVNKMQTDKILTKYSVAYVKKACKNLYKAKQISQKP